MNSFVRRLIILVISVSLLLIPIIFWGNKFQVGGDDTRLYYIFPKQMLQDYAGNIVSNNTLGVNGGYGAQSFIIPILLIIIALKTIIPFVNTQALMYGLNLIGGFIFFYLFTDLWFEDKKDTITYWSRIVSSLFYLLSTFVTKTVFSTQLLAQYTISVFPMVFYLFVRSVKENKIFFTALAALCYSAFSSTLQTVPWFGAMAFASLPMLFALVKRYRYTFMKMTLIFVVLVFGLNFYWLFHELYPLFVKSEGSSIISSVSSSTLRQNNINLIQALSYLNNPINQLAAYIRSSWQERLNFTFNKSYGIVYFLTILIAGMKVGKLGKKYCLLYTVALLGLLFSFSLVTPSFGDWNVAMFEWFNNHIPMFAMFRNMYDKFGIAVSFQFAFALCVSIVIIAKRIKTQYIVELFCILLVFITVWTARDFLFPRFSTTNNFINISGEFNQDFLNLTLYIRAMHESARFAWFPLNFASYTVIEDKLNPGHYYYGSSPMQFLAGISDYTGFQSFATSADPDLNFQMLGLLHTGQFEEIGKILQRMNVKYIIVSRYNIPKQADDHLNFEGTIDAQTTAFNALLTGDKIKEFGSRYTLYAINKRFNNEKIFLTDNTKLYPENITSVIFQKTYPYQYEIELPITDKEITLAFLEPFDRLWQLSVVNNEGISTVISNVNHFMIYRYGNGWIFNPSAFVGQPAKISGGGAEMIHLRIYFTAQRYVGIANGISVLFWSFGCIYTIYSVAMLLKRGHKKETI